MDSCAGAGVGEGDFTFDVVATGVVPLAVVVAPFVASHLARGVGLPKMLYPESDDWKYPNSVQVCHIHSLDAAAS
ncbi:unnamed protein product [Heligmosomoides polygyrus]|uniref:Uncharacterized protein n=1 Tax=Heligmosomoides polygyrus TaxID=6339 RepID=A0A3P8FTM6_HELPZ|nr:unnamed protein product [Heligmosomoides polygyrus]